NPKEARAKGISMVFQHFNLFDTMTVAQNVWLGLTRTSLEQVRASIVAKATEYGLDIDPARPVHTLSVGEMQRVEIIRALLTRPELLILDEPTSVLTPQAVEKLFVVLKKLASEGCSILYISHKLHEIRELCTACTVLRGGKVTGVCNPQEESNASLSRLMIGAEPPQLEHRTQATGPSRLRVRQLSLPCEDQFGVDLHGINLDVSAGEVLGIAGVSGNGQKELLYALSGEDCRARPGSICMGEQDVSGVHPGGRRKRGLHCVPEERLGRGAVPGLSLAHNLLLTRTLAISHPRFAGGWIQVKKLEHHAQRIISTFKVKANGPHAVARSLSGGNLQKFIVGREMDAQPSLFIVSQPTWGVDVGAAAQIRAAILALRDAGCAVLLVSEELEELFELCDRMQVIARGRLSPSLPIAQASVEKIGVWMSGLWEPDAAPASKNSTAEVQHVAA
ncbi:MAG: ATP-binding cassette domain-containing protein, partial [Rhodoferax sp.]|nr:ATP-binding cassette domain-containing protein [Rhodoferax sp.]